MNQYWTARKSINGLRHFVLLNSFFHEGEDFFLLVSVLDAEINLKISKSDLLNAGEWEPGWKNLNKSSSISNEYVKFKKKNRKEKNQIFINNDSIFNIS